MAKKMTIRFPATGASDFRERGYAANWADGPRPVTLVGINFNPKRRNVDMPIVEPL